MTVPVYTRLLMSDAPDADKWVPNVFQNLNLFAEQTVNLFNGSLEIGNNVRGAYLTSTFTTRSDYATGGFDIIKLNYIDGVIIAPRTVLVGQISAIDGTKILNAVMVSNWVANINVAPIQINIGYITGLTASKTYQIQLLVL